MEDETVIEAACRAISEEAGTEQVTLRVPKGTLTKLRVLAGAAGASVNVLCSGILTEALLRHCRKNSGSSSSE